MCIKWITNENLLYSTGNSYPCQSPKITTVNILEFIHSVIHIWHFFLARIVSVCSATYFFLNLTIMLEQLSKTLLFYSTNYKALHQFTVHIHLFYLTNPLLLKYLACL